MIHGRRRCSDERSDNQPDSSLNASAIASAMPSISPIRIAGAPSVSARNNGTIGYIISLAESLASDTQLSSRTFSGSLRRASPMRWRRDVLASSTTLMPLFPVDQHALEQPDHDVE